MEKKEETKIISIAQYFGAKAASPECTPQMKWNADKLLLTVNGFLDEAREAGAYDDPIDPDTGTCISGSKGGSGDGGFRLANSTTGSSKSMHKRARAIDIYDPENQLDDWLTGFDLGGGNRNTVLDKHGLYRESPEATLGWCHLQDFAPGSGRSTFNP